ncbi:MAG: flap endonuclease-1 [Nanoarchaeota archaeon]|nr:flap endonuclease-1 [Nanoarchaeota archaeon]
MGVNLKDLILAKDIRLKDLSGKKIGIDAYNWTYQFLSTIRLRTGELLTDSKGRVTSHLIGIFNRTINLLREGIKPVYVWDGAPPPFKHKTLEERERIKQRAEEAFKKAETEEERRKYAQQISRLTEDMISDANKLLELMGVPYLNAPSEGEAQISHMVSRGDLWACASQDWDSLLFGSKILVRNLSISGKKKLPRTRIFRTINPQIILLDENLRRLGISREQLIIIGMLIGTDYCSGVRGFGPKKSLELVKKERTLDNVLKVVKWECEADPHKIFDWFLHPKVTDNYSLEWEEIDKEKLTKFLVDEHDFSLERVESQLKQISEENTKQTGLGKFLK